MITFEKLTLEEFINNYRLILYHFEEDWKYHSTFNNGEVNNDYPQKLLQEEWEEQLIQFTNRD